MEQETIEADVLCIGGGTAGLMAAIHASELGARVVVAEKGNTLRSGAGATGNDDFTCYIPEVHGCDIETVVKELRLGRVGGGLRNPRLLSTWLENTNEIVKLWEDWGIPMKYQGRYEFAGHSFPNRSLRFWLKYEGQMQKPILTGEALKRGVKIVNRVMVFELLGDGNITGALGIDTRQDKLIIFEVKSVILGTGAMMRLYPGAPPSWVSNTRRPNSTVGNGRAMAYRAGAALVNMEMLSRHAGPKYFNRSGQGTWVGVVRDANDKPVGPFVTNPDKSCGDIAIELNTGLFAEYEKSGRGPVYMDCRGISDEDHEFMMHWLKHEGQVALIDHLREEGIDIREHPVEFMTYGLESRGSIYCNDKAETTVAGLYAAGDECGGSISNASTFGWIAGENAARYVAKARQVKSETKRDEVKIEEIKYWLNDVKKRKHGPDWREANIALQQIMFDYVGFVRSHLLLEAGLSHLTRLKKKAYATMSADNQHEIMRCLEVMDLINLGELVFITANERKETRGLHIRSDYIYTNPLMERFLIVRKSEDKPITEWRELES